VAPPIQVEAPAPQRFRDERGAVAGETRGRGAVEGVDPRPDGLDEVVHVADSEQVAGRLVREVAQHPAHHLAHLGLLLPE
jgi:hypothetical protein